MRMTCSICQGTRSRVWRRWDGWQLMQCRICEVIYLDPRPEPEELRNLYERGYHEAHGIGPASDPAGIESQVRVYDDLTRMLTSLAGQPGRLLEIGSGYGYFLACAQRFGWRVHGIELAPEAVAYAREVLQVPMSCGPSDQVEVAGPFDAVVMLHALEHLPDPCEMLKRVHGLLAPDGLLVLVGPNVGSTDRWWHGRQWRGWSLPHHLYHFTVRSLRRLLEETGFSVVRIDIPLWNPIAHVREAMAGDGLRADHPPGQVDRLYRGSALAKIEKVPGVKRLAKVLLGSLLTDRDVTMVARRRGRE